MTKIFCSSALGAGTCYNIGVQKQVEVNNHLGIVGLSGPYSFGALGDCLRKGEENPEEFYYNSYFSTMDLKPLLNCLDINYIAANSTEFLSFVCSLYFAYTGRCLLADMANLASQMSNTPPSQVSFRTAWLGLGGVLFGDRVKNVRGIEHHIYKSLRGVKMTRKHLQTMHPILYAKLSTSSDAATIQFYKETDKNNVKRKQRILEFNQCPVSFIKSIICF
jgi:hypothetical protein